MLRCTLCAHERGTHDDACPERAAPGMRIVADHDYSRGYRDGRSGRAIDVGSPAYRLGWRCGVVALEEAENGYDPRW